MGFLRDKERAQGGSFRAMRNEDWQRGFRHKALSPNGKADSHPVASPADAYEIAETGCVRSLVRQSLHQFPVKQGKYREFSQNWAEMLRSNVEKASVSRALN